jgi:hypothetical protein
VARWQTIYWRVYQIKRKFLGNDEFNFPRQKRSFSIQTNKVEGNGWLKFFKIFLFRMLKSIRYKKLRLILRNNRKILNCFGIQNQWTAYVNWIARVVTSLLLGSYSNLT